MPYGNQNISSLNQNMRLLALSPEKRRIPARERTSPARPRAETLHLSPHFDRRKWEKDDESDYMDMTPKSTPKHHTTPTKKPFIRSHTVEYGISGFSSTPGSPRSNSLRNQFEECDYADMSGRGSNPELTISRKYTSAQTSPRPDRSQTMGSPRKSPSYASLDDLTSSKLRSSSAISQSSQNVDSRFNFSVQSPSRQRLDISPSHNWQTLKQKVISPFHQPSSSYIEGRFDKDDDDDYDTLDSMKTVKTRNASPSKAQFSQQTKAHLSLARSQKTLPNQQKLSSYQNSPHLPLTRARSARYPSNYDSNNNNAFNCDPVHSNVDVNSASNQPSLPALTALDQSLRRFHQKESEHWAQPPKMYEKPRSQSADAGSPSRSSKSGGVQNRINRWRQNQDQIFAISESLLMVPKANTLSTSNHDITGHNRSKSVSEIPQSPLTSGSPQHDLSSTTSALLIGGRLCVDGEPRRAQSFQNLVGKGADGAQIMKSLSSSKDHLNLDKDYLDWFTKTTPYSSRRSPTSSVQCQKDQKQSLTKTRSNTIGVSRISNHQVDKKEFPADQSSLKTLDSKNTRAGSVTKKKKSFWKRKKDKVKNDSKSQETPLKTHKPSTVESKIKKSRKSWTLNSKKRRSSITSLQNDLEAVAILKSKRKSEELDPTKPLIKDRIELKINKSKLQEEEYSRTLLTANHTQTRADLSRQKFSSDHASIGYKKQTPQLASNEDVYVNTKFSAESYFEPDLMESNPLEIHSDDLNRRVCDQGYPELSAVPRSNINFSDSQMQLEETRNTPMYVVPLLDISQESNYDEEPESSQALSPLTRKLYGSLRSKTLGRIFNKKGSVKKSHDVANDSDKFDDKLDFSFSPSLKVGESIFYKEPLLDSHQSSTFSEKDEDFLPEFDSNAKFLTHGFILPQSNSDSVAMERKEETLLFQVDKNKRRRSSGRKKEQHLSLYNSIKRLRSKSSDLDEIEPYQASASMIHEDQLDGRREYTDDDLGSPGEKLAGSKEHFLYTETATPPNSKPKLRPIFQKPSSRALEVARLLLHCIRTTQPELISGYEEIEEDNHRFFMAHDECQPGIEELLRRSYAKGHDLVAWTQELLRVKQKFEEKSDLSYKATLTPTRRHIAGMWQVLFEQGAIFHVKCDEQFEDGDYYYGFHEEVTTPHLFPNNHTLSMEKNKSAFNFEEHGHTKTSEIMAKLMSHWIEEMELTDGLSYLNKHCHDAMFRKALRQRPDKRTPAELVMIYEEILHIKTLAHLSDSVKRELAGVLKFEFHQKVGTVLFRQGDEGTSWYIILHGSVKVDVLGKGIVCTLQEGAEFGNLALVNDAPRSATILSAEPNCHFMKVDKVDFVRILKDVEANTVRLKEHDQDVLILEKIRSATRSSSEKKDSAGELESDPGHPKQSHRYVVTAGTPERILEHILEYIQPWKRSLYDETMEDFILMYPVFMKSRTLFENLLKNYKAEDALSVSFAKSMKRKIVYFVVRWSHIVRCLGEDEEEIDEFLQELKEEIEFDGVENQDYKQLKTELAKMYKVKSRINSLTNNNGESKSGTYLIIEECAKMYQAGGGQVDLQRPIEESDEVLLKVYNCVKEYATLKLPISSTADEILHAAVEKMNKHAEKDTRLFEIQESGENIVIPKNRRSVVTSININSVLSICVDKDAHFVVSKSLHDSLPKHNFHFDVVSSIEMAYHITDYDWTLVNNVHVMEYVYKVFGAKKFTSATPNLDVLSRRFNQLAYWPPTEICRCANANKRALILRKFIKIAQHLKLYQNMNGFMAVMIGICNQAVSRLSSTWEKIPAKYRKMMHEFEAILDPSRNHRKYRVLASALEPPFIPYFPLLMKDMTFQHEGNESQKQNLVNFEKMHMISNSVKTIIKGCSEKIDADNLTISAKAAEETKRYVRSFRVITDQKTLNELSAQIEPKR